MKFIDYINGPINIPDAAAMAAERGVRELHITAMTGRCGSSLLTQMSQIAGFGECAEIFNERAEAFITERCGTREPNEAIANYIASCARKGIAHFQIDDMRLAELNADFTLWPSVRISHLFRRNVIAQALSYYNASATGLWHVTQKGESRLPASTNPKPAEHHYARIVRGEAWLKQCCPANAGTYFYEDLISSTPETLMHLAEGHGFHIDGNAIDRIYRDGNLMQKIVRHEYPRQYREYCRERPDHAEAVRRRSLAGGFLGDAPHP